MKKGESFLIGLNFTFNSAIHHWLDLISVIKPRYDT